MQADAHVFANGEISYTEQLRDMAWSRMPFLITPYGLPYFSYCDRFDIRNIHCKLLDMYTMCYIYISFYIFKKISVFSVFNVFRKKKLKTEHRYLLKYLFHPFHISKRVCSMLRYSAKV